MYCLFSQKPYRIPKLADFTKVKWAQSSRWAFNLLKRVGCDLRPGSHVVCVCVLIHIYIYLYLFICIYKYT